MINGVLKNYILIVVFAFSPSTLARMGCDSSKSIEKLLIVSLSFYVFVLYFEWINCRLYASHSFYLAEMNSGTCIRAIFMIVYSRVLCVLVCTVHYHLGMSLKGKRGAILNNDSFFVQILSWESFPPLLSELSLSCILLAFVSSW